MDHKHGVNGWDNTRFWYCERCGAKSDPMDWLAVRAAFDRHRLEDCPNPRMRYKTIPHVAGEPADITAEKFLTANPHDFVAVNVWDSVVGSPGCPVFARNGNGCVQVLPTPDDMFDGPVARAKLAEVEKRQAEEF